MTGRSLAAGASTLLACVVLADGVAAAPEPARWRPLLNAPGIADVVGPRSDGQLVLSTRSGLLLLSRDGVAREFARGFEGYNAATAGEPSVAFVPAYRRLAGVNCSFHRDD